MSIKKVVIPIILLTLSIGGLFVFITFNKSPDKNKSASVSPVKKEIKLPAKEYKDPAGFSFSYPGELELNKKEAQDEKTYSSIELVTEDKEGAIQINVEDATVVSLEAWLKENAIKGTTQNLKLSELPAVQYDQNEKITTIALDEGVIFNLTTDYKQNKEYWTKILENITSSFKFTPPPPADTSSDSTYDESAISDEGEEIVE